MTYSALAHPFRRLALAVIACFLSAATLGAADRPAAAVHAFTIDVPAGKLSLKEVHDVVMAASVGRQWNVKEDSDDRIVIHLNHRKNEATVFYELTEASITAYCEGYATNGKGVRKGPEQPKGWLKYLKNDITKGINTAAFVGGK